MSETFGQASSTPLDAAGAGSAVERNLQIIKDESCSSEETTSEMESEHTRANEDQETQDDKGDDDELEERSEHRND